MTTQPTDPKISVVILNWNRFEDTLLATQSVLKQDFPYFEVIIWDNASGDSSVSELNRIFQQDTRVRVIASPINYGVAGGRNRAYAEARGRIVFSLDSDAIIENADALRLIAESFDHDHEIGIVSTEVIRPDGHLMWPFARDPAKWRNRIFQTIRADGCSFATRRDLFLSLGGFAEHLSPYGAEDQYYALRVLAAGKKVIYDPRSRVVHAFHPGGRHGAQFAMHVRNMLWIPLELFPFPHNLIRTASLCVHLARDAHEQKEWKYYWQGVFTAILHCEHRQPMSWIAWKYFRRLVRDDKAHAHP